MAAEIEALRGKVEQREVTAEELRKSIIDPFRKIWWRLIDNCIVLNGWLNFDLIEWLRLLEWRMRL